MDAVELPTISQLKIMMAVLWTGSSLSVLDLKIPDVQRAMLNFAMKFFKS